jgi:hypothetical protein
MVGRAIDVHGQGLPPVDGHPADRIGRPAADGEREQALDKVALGLLDGHAQTCVVGAEPEQRDARTEEMMATIGRLLRRG